MRLRITTPLARLVDEEMRGLRAEDASGWFGILPGHADFLTRLAVSVVSWTRPDGSAMHCAVRGGVLTVSGGREVAIATAEAVADADLLRLDETVLAAFQAKAEAERVEHSAQAQLQLNAIRQIMKHLRAAQRAGARL
ncbi:F0F1 ATP synthase subunit epsilon [Acidocella sp. KAb 2-4]|uniref:F0F1 ATP synthase subunit epsilon n=1 Tax=Acidocella sp. KAb 2-4 TaxID=2885158 RepID=UPI001D0660B0|nr:F0F1 ATP synthase subunit epsilon [Acidocella sp. KAb 2-4]MCB5945600.1 F0F1 ATP synthase subunit epsilon [Acidocella sp. KAb 2-4]